MKNIVLLLTFTALCTTLICPRHSFAQHFVDGQMPDTFLAAHEKSRVNSVAFSPDGKSLASGSADRTVRLWDVTRQPKTPKATLSDHGDEVYAVAFSPDGTRLASGGADGRVRLWTAP